MTFLGLRPSDTPALIDAPSGQTLSYRELLTRGAALAAQLGQAKQLIVLLTRNDVFSTTVYLGSQLGGHTVTLLDGTPPIGRHADVIADYGPEWVAGPPGTAGELQACGFKIRSVEDHLDGELVALLDASTRPIYQHLAVLLTTSGTTGSRKFVRLSAANVESNARSIASYLGLAPAERPITSLPIHYSFGLSVLNSHWHAGAAIVLSAESIMQRSFWDSTAGNHATSFAGVPYTYQMLERVGFREMDLPSIRTLQQAGGALDTRLTRLYHDHMAARHGRLVVMYGQTEATARIAWVPPDRLSEKLGSAGIAIPGGRLRIAPGRTTHVQQPVVGEIIYEGPNVMLGYAERRADLELGDELLGMLHTGDLGYLDDDGFLFVTGRSKRIAKVFGLRINLDEVERLLREHGPAAVVAGDDAIWGFCAFGTEGSVVELRDRLSRRLRISRSAFMLRHVPDIPVTESGKVDYRRVERWTKD